MRRLILLIPALLAAAVLTACGSGGSSTGATSATSATGSTDYNAADVIFAQNMIPHHRQAIEMADLAGTHAQNPEVKTLAPQIRAAQTPEITTMVGWLTAWKQPTAPPAGGGGSGPGMGGPGMGGPGMNGHGMNGHGSETMMPGDTMEGMMSSADMTALGNATGPAFDKMFLTMMIAHHQGAVTMAKTEIRDGRYTPAQQLAENIQNTQNAEITSMRNLLAKI